MERTTVALKIGAIRSRLSRLGWSTAAASFVTLHGQKLWMVRAKRAGVFFSVQGNTAGQAWRAAARLARQLAGGGKAKARSVVPFPRYAIGHQKRA